MMLIKYTGFSQEQADETKVLEGEELLTCLGGTDHWGGATTGPLAGGLKHQRMFCKNCGSRMLLKIDVLKDMDNGMKKGQVLRGEPASPRRPKSRGICARDPPL